jgi:hypothetical protein
LWVSSRRPPLGFKHEPWRVARSPAPLRLTYAAGDHIATDILRDGRILFEAPFPDGSGSKTRDIYTVYPDGSGVETYRCDHGHDRHSARETESGDIVFETAGHLAEFASPSTVEIPLNTAVRRATGVPVRPRTPPKWFPSSLGDRNGANTLCLNVYTSKDRIPEAIVNFVRVWAQDQGAAVALGEAPVEHDGSFYVNVPSERPIRFELLDANRKTVAAEKGWLWMRRGEQRVCVGCHAGPERAPDNAAPQVLLRTTEPVRMELPK